MSPHRCADLIARTQHFESCLHINTNQNSLLTNLSQTPARQSPFSAQNANLQMFSKNWFKQRSNVANVAQTSLERRSNVAKEEPRKNTFHDDKICSRLCFSSEHSDNIVLRSIWGLSPLQICICAVKFGQRKEVHLHSVTSEQGVTQNHWANIPKFVKGVRYTLVRESIACGC